MNKELRIKIDDHMDEINRIKNKLVIVADSREQTPYVFESKNTVTLCRTLPVGDYSIAGFEYDIAVERKELNDFINSISHERGRFFTEIQKLSQFDGSCIVVEASMEDIFNKKYQSDMHPNSIIGTAMSITVDYQVPVFFCGGRTMAMHFTEQFLKRWKMKIEKKCEDFS